jgi:hypothetical protein
MKRESVTRDLIRNRKVIDPLSYHYSFVFCYSSQRFPSCIFYVASILSVLHKSLFDVSTQRYDVGVNVKIAEAHGPEQSHSYNLFFVHHNVTPTGTSIISFWMYSKFLNFKTFYCRNCVSIWFSPTRATYSAYCNSHSVTPRIGSKGGEVPRCVVPSSLTSSILQPCTRIFYVTPSQLRCNTSQSHTYSQLPKLIFCISSFLVFLKTF